MIMKKEYFKPEMVATELSAMGRLMDVSGWGDMPGSMPQPAPRRSGAMRNTLIKA